VIEVAPAETAAKAVAVALDQMKPGDSLVAFRLRDLFINVRDFVLLVDTLERRQCALELIVERINTGQDRAVAALCSELVATERVLHRTKVRDGLEATVRSGQTIGRRRKLTSEDVAVIRSAIDSGDITVREAARQFGVARGTLQRHLAELRAKSLENPS
jgi:DNA invertase Pin-like site-specific DNA recombinase